MVNFRAMKVLSIDQYKRLVGKDLGLESTQQTSNLPPPPPSLSIYNEPEGTGFAGSNEQVIEEPSKKKKKIETSKPSDSSHMDDVYEFPSQDLPQQLVCGTEDSKSVERVVGDLPEPQKGKAKQLLAYLCSTKAFKWLPSGEVQLNGKTYPYVLFL
jgi:hypothetical protein